MVLRSSIRGIPETLFGRILMFVWSIWALETSDVGKCQSVIRQTNIVTIARNLFLAAVKELFVSYHNMDIYQIIWFLDYGNLI